MFAAPVETIGAEFFERCLGLIFGDRDRHATKNRSEERSFCSWENALGAGHIDRGRALLAVNDLEADDIANLELIERHAGELLGVEEQVLRLAFASDETESTIRERLDSTSHNGAALNFN